MFRKTILPEGWMTKKTQHSHPSCQNNSKGPHCTRHTWPPSSQSPGHTSTSGPQDLSRAGGQAGKGREALLPWPWTGKMEDGRNITLSPHGRKMGLEPMMHAAL